MQILRYSRCCPNLAHGSILTIGKFDAIHLGHQHLLNIALQEASKGKKKLIVMTFEPHPLTVLKSDTRNIRILPLSEKIKRLADMGVDFLFIQKFTKDFANLSADDFVKKILVDDLKINHLLVGEDFVFGKNREGNIAVASQLARKYNFNFTAVPLHEMDQINYSSSQIRAYLSTGNIQKASSLLGYNYYICGRVCAGNKRGKKIGFATANISLNDIFYPICGVYAVKIYIDSEQQTYYGVANLGAKPTFNENSHVLEVHIFDFNREIYGKKLKVELLSYLRSQRKFENMEELHKQIKLDVKLAKNYLYALI